MCDSFLIFGMSREVGVMLRSGHVLGWGGVGKDDRGRRTGVLGGDIR
jgi:hypothetical protein